MPPDVRLFGTDDVEIEDLESWFLHAPPEKGEAQWKDGYSAKEQARAWLPAGSPAMPDELWSPISNLVGDGVDEFFGRPEHRTRLDNYSRARQHDLFGCARQAGATVLVVGIEAKACEGFDGLVCDRATASPPSNKRARCNLLARALFGKEVLDERSGQISDADLGQYGYQLWTATVGTIIEAQKRGVTNALVVVHQFAPGDLEASKNAGDKRDWANALRTNAVAFETFSGELQATGSKSHSTEFVQAGTTIHVANVNSTIAA
jgi:hypothetical protein